MRIILVVAVVVLISSCSPGGVALVLLEFEGLGKLAFDWPNRCQNKLQQSEGGAGLVPFLSCCRATCENRMDGESRGDSQVRRWRYDHR